MHIDKRIKISLTWRLFKTCWKKKMTDLRRYLLIVKDTLQIKLYSFWLCDMINGIIKVTTRYKWYLIFFFYFAYLFESGISFRQLLIYYLFRKKKSMEEGTGNKKRLEFDTRWVIRKRPLNLLKIQRVVFFCAWSSYTIKKEINQDQIESRTEA